MATKYELERARRDAERDFLVDVLEGALVELLTTGAPMTDGIAHALETRSLPLLRSAQRAVERWREQNDDPAAP